jgi:uncharacterized protein (DUF427 family)
VRVVHAGIVVADTTAALRVLETSQPPAFYLPPGDVALGRLSPGRGSSWCEWKGAATYWHLDDVADAAWSYTSPTPTFDAIRDHLAFYAQKVDECWVDDERVLPNPGNFYGGWLRQIAIFDHVISDADRNTPLPVGTIITYRFQEFTKDMSPRFPVFVGRRGDV